MHLAIALLDMMSAGVCAGTLVQVARRKIFVRIAFAWLYAALAACFIVARIVLPDNSYVAAIVAAVCLAAVATALARARSEPFGTMLVAIPALVILTITIADVYDLQAQEPLRGLAGPLLAVPALAALVRLFYLYRKRNRTV